MASGFHSSNTEMVWLQVLLDDNNAELSLTMFLHVALCCFFFVFVTFWKVGNDLNL